jgi:hypothetical protein
MVANQNKSEEGEGPDKNLEVFLEQNRARTMALKKLLKYIEGKQVEEKENPENKSGNDKNESNI